MTGRSNTVAVTGASGYIGTRLLRELEKRGDGRLVALDTRPLALPVHNIVARRKDVSRPIDDILQQHRVSTLVHLASATGPDGSGGDGDSTTQANLLMLESVLHSCERAGVNNVVFLSSHLVYGVRPDNPIPLTEESQLQPNRDYPPSNEKFLCEGAVQRYGLRHPEARLTILRTPPVLGPSTPPDPSRIVPTAVRPGRRPGGIPFQFLHEDDLARAITTVVDRQTAGTFNLAAEGIATYSEIAEALHPRVKAEREVPSRRIPGLPPVDLPPIPRLERRDSFRQRDVLKHPIILSTGKVKHVLGLRARYSSLETLISFVNAALV